MNVSKGMTAQYVFLFVPQYICFENTFKRTIMENVWPQPYLLTKTNLDKTLHSCIYEDKSGSTELSKQFQHNSFQFTKSLKYQSLLITPWSRWKHKCNNSPQTELRCKCLKCSMLSEPLETYSN